MELQDEIIYGPVSSWRLDRSLGVDIICGRNICSFDCLYCQLGPSEEKTMSRRVFVPTQKVLNALLRKLPEVKEETDIITVSGTGEPTLASNLGEIIDGIHRVATFPVAVLTNGSLLFRKKVREEVSRAEIVVGSLDAADYRSWKKINRPHPGLKFSELIRGLKTFSLESDAFFALEVMFFKENKDSAVQIAKIMKEINPDEVQINTPRRGSRVKPLTEEEIEVIKKPFEERKLNIRAVYESTPRTIKHFIGPEKIKHLKRKYE